jgi:GTP cyclohydrolase I
MTIQPIRSSFTGIDADRVQRAVLEILQAIGDDPAREGLAETPARVARMYGELFEGMRVDPKEVLQATFEVGHHEMVILKDIPFYSICEHHLMPFHGVAAVGYIPDGTIVGLSKIARLVDVYARRPQVQEQLTSQVADTLMEVLDPDGVAVIIEAEHLCMTQRGVRKPGSRMVTSATRGRFRKSDVTRAEFLALVRGQ